MEENIPAGIVSLTSPLIFELSGSRLDMIELRYASISHRNFSEIGKQEDPYIALVNLPAEVLCIF